MPYLQTSGEVAVEVRPAFVWAPLLIAALVPIASVVGTIIANEINKLYKEGKLKWFK